MPTVSRSRIALESERQRPPVAARLHFRDGWRILGAADATTTKRPLTGNRDDFIATGSIDGGASQCRGLGSGAEFDFRSVPVTCEWVSEDGRFKR